MVYSLTSNSDTRDNNEPFQNIKKRKTSYCDIKKDKTIKILDCQMTDYPLYVMIVSKYKLNDILNSVFYFYKSIYHLLLQKFFYNSLLLLFFISQYIKISSIKIFISV